MVMLCLSNYWKLHKTDVRIFSGLFHSNGNCNYSVIETYDEYVMRCMHRNNPQLYEHLVTRFFTNLTGKPYSAQSHDARHEESNKKGQNMFPGNSLEELDLAFRIVDDVWDLREKKFLEMGLSENRHSNVVIPDLENIISKMRTAIPKSELLEYPLFSEAVKSYDGKMLNPAMISYFENSEKRRQSDILNVIRFNNFNSAYDSKKKKFGVLKDEKSTEVTKTDLTNQILTLIYAIEDAELKSNLKEYFDDLEHSLDKLEFFLNVLIERKYFILFD